MSQFRGGSLEVGEDLLQAVTDGGETLPTEGEQLGGALDIVEECVDVDVVPGTSGQGMRVRTDGPGFAAMDRAMAAAYGREVVQSGSGGSVPLVPELSAAIPDAEILLYGASDEKSQYHSIDESVDLAELERAALAEALLFLELAGS